MTASSQSEQIIWLLNVQSLSVLMQAAKLYSRLSEGDSDDTEIMVNQGDLAPVEYLVQFSKRADAIDMSLEEKLRKFRTKASGKLWDLLEDKRPTDWGQAVLIVDKAQQSWKQNNDRVLNVGISSSADSQVLKIDNPPPSADPI